MGTFSPAGVEKQVLYFNLILSKPDLFASNGDKHYFKRRFFSETEHYLMDLLKTKEANQKID